MKESGYSISLLPIAISPIEEAASTIAFRPTANALLGVTSVENPLRDYLIYHAALRKRISELELLAGLGYADDGRGLMAEFGVDYPITNSLLASYRHYSSPNYGDDGSDFLGLTYTF